MESGRYKTRARILIFALMLWAVLVAAHVFYFSVYARESFLDSGLRMAWKGGEITAVRGKICDANGVPVAWTEIHFDLVIENDSMSFRKMLELRSSLPFPMEMPSGVSYPVVIRKDLSPEDIQVLERFIMKYPALKIMSRQERCYIDYPEVRKILGSVKWNGTRLSGVSGLELAGEHKLRGVNGIYKVMLSPSGKWIDGTFQLERNVQHGIDVILSATVDELKKGASVDYVY